MCYFPPSLIISVGIERKNMDAIWEQLSQPLPPVGLDAREVVTPELRRQLAARLADCEFEYRSEGRANIVFGIRDAGADAGTPNTWFGATLLRVPKTTPGAPIPCSYEDLQRFREHEVEPAVGREFVVPQILLLAGSGSSGDGEAEGGISEQLAARLNETRARSPRSRKDGGAVQPGPALMLIQDMGATAARPLALEFKPKWLAQSPIAPENARRCRSCAREARRNAKILAAAAAAAAESSSSDEEAVGGHHKKEEEEEEVQVTPPVCRLGLVHDDLTVFNATVEALAPATWSQSDRRRLAAALRHSGVLARLHELQVAGDPPPSPPPPAGSELGAGSTLFERPSDAAFGLAMTLRDCSCFVLMAAADGGEGSGAEEAIIRLADVDKKNWVHKQNYWQESHRRLVQEGWYAAQEDTPMETHCLLPLQKG